MEPPHKKRKLVDISPETHDDSKLSSFRQNDSLTVKISISKGADNGKIEDDYVKVDYKNTSRYCHLEMRIQFDFLKLMNKFFYYNSFFPNENPLLKNGLKKPSKNIMEATYAVYHFCKYLKQNNIEIKKDNKLFLEVGSGTTPQVCPLLFHLNSNEKTTYISVDPILKDNVLVNPQRTEPILCFSKKVEEVELTALSLDKDLIIVFSVHGHANMQKLWDRLKGEKVIFVVIPCCKKFVNLPEEKAVYHTKELAVPTQKDSIYIFTNLDDLENKHHS